MTTHRLSTNRSELLGFRRLASTAASSLALAGLATIVLGSSGCIQDTDCGICDPDNLILESISGINYQSNKVHIIGPQCEGDACPKEQLTEATYFLEKIIRCEETEEAQESANAQEYCRLSPLVTAFGIEFIFNNLLDPTSIELVRKRPDEPQLFEVYDWKTDVLQVQGPITRFNGDYNRGGRDEADTISRLVNLSCIDNVAANGGTFSFESYKDPTTNPCNGFNPTTGLPMKMAESATIKAARGIWTASGNSCSSPEEGPDTCCSYCDYLLSTKIDRYGIDDTGVARNANLVPGAPAAIQCGDATTAGSVIDKFAECSGFVANTDRSDEEQTWRYEWCPPGGECVTQDWKLPIFDKIRETHPKDRPVGVENLDAKCTTTAECSDVHGLTGTECVGTHSDSEDPCLTDAYDADSTATCDRGVCRPQWVATCRFDETTTGADVAFCQDRRFGTAGTAACLLTTDGVTSGEFGPAGPGGAGLTDCDEEGAGCVQRGGGAALAFADWNENGRLAADEACQRSLYGSGVLELADDEDPAIRELYEQDGFPCDPFYQENLVERDIYQRDENLPGPSRACICPDNEDLDDGIAAVDSACEDAIRTGCYDSNGKLVEGRAGEYAVKFVARAGGIIYDPAIKGFDWRPADLGGVPRADIETCAENNTDRLMAPLNRHDGWRAADTFTPENFEDFDRAMCSGQEYTVVFNEPGNDDNPAFVIDKADNTLAGKSIYKFETAQFHVQPGSGFPTDNLRIGACDDFSLRFSNKYDSSPENLAKLQLFRTSCTGEGNERVCELTSPDPECDSDNPPPGACCVTSPVAGGADCFETEPELEAALNTNACAAPCLTVNIENQFIGEVKVQIDPIEFGQYLELNEVYRMLAPTAATLASTQSDPDLYQAVFWDACGMPLVAENADSYAYDFRIDNPKCKEDKDKDGIPLSCDNADNAFNPDQDDIDGDGVGDAIDLCPAAGGDPNNTADSDNDGVGNECDSCRQTLNQYNANAVAAAVPDYMMVRNIPDQNDFDEDGIGDVCDNCVVTANCENFSQDNPYEVADPIAYDDNDLCQRDDNSSMIGDICEGQTVGEFAAGPIGFGDQDDFDQDGLVNSLDGCPRQPLPDAEPIECTSDNAAEVCGEGRPCSPAGICNHLDSDGDGVGNACDTCAFQGNPSQAMEGGSQDDDPDGDFVGELCEVGATKGCGERKNARPFGFYEVAALGNCCTTQLIAADETAVASAAEEGRVLSLGDLLIAGTCTDTADLSTCLPLTAPHPELPNARDAEGNLLLSLPVRTLENCTMEQEEQLECRSLPTALETQPGILIPPPGCDAALEAAAVTALENLRNPLTDLNFTDQSNPIDALWQNICFLPQVDQDYDGIGDACDKCPFAFDPTDAEYVDANGRLWPNDGAACNGDFLPDNICELEEMNGGGMGDTDDSGGSSGGGVGGSSGG